MSEASSRSVQARALIKSLKSVGFHSRKHVIWMPEKYYGKQPSKNRYQYTAYALWCPHKNIRIYLYPNQEIWGYSIFMDTDTSFDKLSKCPVQLPLPSSTREEILFINCIDSLLKYNEKWDCISDSFVFDYWIKSYDAISGVLKKVSAVELEEIKRLS